MRPDHHRARWISLLVDAALFGISLAVLRHVLTAYHLRTIVAAIHDISLSVLGASLLLTVLGYAALVGYDYLSLRLAAKPVPIRRMWSSSFISHAVQNSAPIAIVSGGGVRYRLFRRLGITGAETAAVVAANTMTFVIGLLLVAGIAFAVDPIPIPAAFHLPRLALRPIGVAFLLLVVSAYFLARRGVGTVHVWRFRLELPNGRELLEQLLVSTADWVFSAAALYVLMAAAGPLSFPRFMSGFLLTQIVTQIVPLPGGIGVFEAAMLVLRPPSLPAPPAAAALLVYRVVYYLIPLFAAAVMLALRASNKPRSEQQPVMRVGREMAPHVFAVLTFIVGAILLVVTVLPSQVTGFRAFGRALRVVIVEGSYFLSSIVGMGLLLLAFGLERRIKGAFRLTVGLLVLGILSSLLRALDLAAAGLLTALLLLLLAARREFYRKVPFSREPLAYGWVAAVTFAVLGLGWLGIYLQVQHQYSGSLWWSFALDRSAPRTLRVTLSVLMAMGVFFGVRLVVEARRTRRLRKRT
jgi:phosphatidylglycerol lysyltransferase